MSDDGPSAREKLISTLAPDAEAAGQLARFVRNPVVFILTTIVAQILLLGGYVVNSVLLVFDYVVAFVVGGQRLLFSGFAFIQGTTTRALTFVATAGFEAIQAAGPLGPPIAVAITAVAAYLTWETLKRLPRAVWTVYQTIPGT